MKQSFYIPNNVLDKDLFYISKTEVMQNHSIDGIKHDIFDLNLCYNYYSNLGEYNNSLKISVIITDKAGITYITNKKQHFL